MFMRLVFGLCFLLLGSSTLPRATTRATETDGNRNDKVTAATSSTSLYDNVAGANHHNAQGKLNNAHRTF